MHIPPPTSYIQPTREPLNPEPRTHISRFIVSGTLVLVLIAACIGGFYSLNHFSLLCTGFYHSGSVAAVTVSGNVALFINAKNTVEALRITDGGTLWQEAAGVQVLSPISDVRQMVYVTEHIPLAPGGMHLVAHDITQGTVQWQVALSDYTAIYQLVLTDTSVIGVLQTSALGSQQGAVVAWSRTDGRQLWQSPVAIDEGPPDTHQLNLYGATLLFHDQSTLVALDMATGKARWQLTDGAYHQAITSVTSDASQVIMDAPDPHSQVSGQQVITSLDLATGKRQWQASIQQKFAVIPVLANGIYYVMEDSTLVAFASHSGTVHWRVATNLLPFATSLMLANDAVLLIGEGTLPGTQNGTIPGLSLLLFDATTGQYRASTFLPDGNLSERGYLMRDGRIWLTQYPNTTVAYDTHSLMPLLHHISPNGTLPQSTISGVTSDAVVVAFGLVRTNQCPIRHVAGVQALSSTDGHALWAIANTLSY